MPSIQTLKSTGRRQTVGAGLVLLGMVATVGSALAFEHVGGYLPCPLCLDQRVPYYAAIPIAALAFFAARLLPGLAVRALLVVVGGAMLYAAGLGAYHAGVEWGLWAGPTDCAVSGGFDMGGDLMAQLDTVRGPSCAEPALRVLGLSLAVWNAILASVLAAIALLAASARGSADEAVSHSGSSSVSQ